MPVALATWKADATDQLATKLKDSLGNLVKPCLIKEK